MPKIPWFSDDISRSLLLLVPLLAVAAAGCATRPVTATAVVHSDGSFQRTLTYTSLDFDEENVSSRPAPATVTGTDLAGVFTPPQGAAWTVTARQDRKGNREITATRPAAVGQPIIGDLGVLTPHAKYQAVCLANRVEVVRLGPNRLQYREIVRWRGPLPAFFRTTDPAFRRLVVRALPPDSHIAWNHAAVDRIALRLQRGMYAPLLAYAPSPLLTSSSAAKSAAQEKRDAERWLRSLARAAVSPEITTDADKERVADRFADALAKSASNDSEKAGSDASPVSSGVALNFRAVLPGRIVATNGTPKSDNPTKRQVEWTLPPEAAALGDVTLTATCETGPNTQKALGP